MDGNFPPSNQLPEVTVDSRPISSGDNITLGRHHLAVHAPGFEPLDRDVWAFYGKNDLGILALETSKGSLSVAVTPVPAKVLLKKEGTVIQQGNAPLRIDRLPVGHYSVVARHGDYEESREITILREQNLTSDFQLNIGNVDLSSDRSNVSFDLSGERRQWHGQLPMRIDDIPAGTYRFSAHRHGWDVSKDLVVNRGELTNGRLEFPYGVIAVTSKPAGLDASIDGAPVGRTPVVLDDQKPGEYRVSVTDGENELSEKLVVQPKKRAEHYFFLQTGSVQISSSPPGAIVVRNGKEIGRPPCLLVPILHVERGRLKSVSMATRPPPLQSTSKRDLWRRTMLSYLVSAICRR